MTNGNGKIEKIQEYLQDKFCNTNNIEVLEFIIKLNNKIIEITNT